MLPQQRLSTTLIQGTFVYPYSLARNSLVEDYELGGIAIQDPSQGHQVQPWYFHWDSVTTGFYTRPGLTGSDTLLFSQSNVFEACAAFDQNMRWISCTTDRTGSTQLRWYDASIPGYTTTVLSDIAACRMTLDDFRANQITTGATDVILTYVKLSTGQLCFRAQRDRYATEYVLTTLPSNKIILTNFGMSSVLRVQWRARYRTFEETIPWL